MFGGTIQYYNKREKWLYVVYSGYSLTLLYIQAARDFGYVYEEGAHPGMTMPDAVSKPASMKVADND